MTENTSQTPTWERLEDQLAWYEAKSASSQRFYKRGKLIELIVAAVVPVVAAVNAPPLLTSGLAAVVVIAEGIQQLYQWQANWLLYRGTAETLKTEKYLFLAWAPPYTGPDRQLVLAERVENILGQEQGRWLQRSQQTDSTAKAEDSPPGTP